MCDMSSMAAAWGAALAPKAAPEAWKVSVEVCEDDESSSTTWYRVSTKFEVTRSTTAIRRYAEFRALKSSFGSGRPGGLRLRSSFPSRSASLYSSKLGAAAAEQRLKGLQAWLREVVSKRNGLDDDRFSAGPHTGASSVLQLWSRLSQITCVCQERPIHPWRDLEER